MHRGARDEAARGPHQLLHLWPSSWQRWAEHGCSGVEWLQPDLTNWVGGKEVRGGETRDQEKLLAGRAWLRPHDFAAASPNISFHGNPGEKRGAFILASEFTLSQRGGGISIGHLLRGQRTRGVYMGLGRPERDKGQEESGHLRC